ncbi:hypothetical protein [Mucilaginibacter sp. BT774]|nr:hypothetical protein [Mucilaginibacter sp. BT774]MDO3627920.1 hypothetical protein [Mucilaginibacter sp. BT774]
MNLPQQTSFGRIRQNNGGLCGVKALANIAEQPGRVNDSGSKYCSRGFG